MGETVHLDAEQLDEIIQKMTRHYTQETPADHLYIWLKEKDPMLFKQWEAIYAIVKNNEEY